jgi:hypothetical protein
MFDTVDQQIPRFQGRTASIWNRMLQPSGVVVITLLVFGCLYFSILALE